MSWAEEAEKLAHECPVVHFVNYITRLIHISPFQISLRVCRAKLSELSHSETGPELPVSPFGLIVIIFMFTRYAGFNIGDYIRLQVISVWYSALSCCLSISYGVYSCKLAIPPFPSSIFCESSRASAISNVRVLKSASSRAKYPKNRVENCSIE